MLRKSAIVVLIGGLLAVGGVYLARRHAAAAEPIKLGILHSLTGGMATSESPVVDGTLLASEEINQAGGVLGRPIHPVVAAGRSDAGTFAREAERFITQERVVTVYVEPENQHTRKIVRIGRIRADGQFDIVWTSEKPVRPVPFPVYRSRDEWAAFLDGLYRGWGGPERAGARHHGDDPAAGDGEARG